MVRVPALTLTVRLPARSVRSSKRSRDKVLRNLGMGRFFSMAVAPPGEKGLGVEAYLGALAICKGQSRQGGDEAPGSRGEYQIAPLNGQTPDSLQSNWCAACMKRALQRRQ